MVTINVKELTTGALMAVLAALFQSFPVFFSEVFVFVTMLSALPIYIIARINLRMAFVSFVCAALLVTLVSPHEALMFTFTNGVVGLALGASSKYLKNNISIISITAIFLTCSLCILNYVIGIPVFGDTLPGSIYIQLAFIFGFATFYSVFYHAIAKYIYNVLF